MSIGSIIKSKRKQKDLTQEQFAEYLNVSVSAVSQWESDKTIPDYSLLIPLANFFDISLDELLGRTPDAKEMVIDEYNKTDMSLANEGKNEARIEMWREALKSFPGDYHCMTMLANSLFLSLVANSKDREDGVYPTSVGSAIILTRGFDDAWREKVIQYQASLYSINTKGWVRRFADIIAEAKEEGPLQNKDFDLPVETVQKLKEALNNKMRENVIIELAKYYLANKQEDTDWVILPVDSFNAYFGTTSFDRKWLPEFPEEIIERKDYAGLCGFKMNI